MRGTATTFFRSFAPAVLGLSLLFLAFSDPGGKCLAAWLCSPPAAEECAGRSRPSAVLDKGRDLCVFAVGLDTVSQKSAAAKLVLSQSASAVEVPTFGIRELAEVHVSAPEFADRSPPLPLYRIQQALLL